MVGLSPEKGLSQSRSTPMSETLGLSPGLSRHACSVKVQRTALAGYCTHLEVVENVFALARRPSRGLSRELASKQDIRTNTQGLPCTRMHGKQGLHTSSCEAATVPIYMLCTVPLPYSTLLKSLLSAEALTLECLHGCFAQHNPLLPAIHSAGTTLKYQAYQG